MKKSCLTVLIVLLLFFVSLFAVKASGPASNGVTGCKNSTVETSNGARSARTSLARGLLPSALQSVLSGTLGANDPEYRVARSGGEYRAVNGLNRFTATIGLDGFTVRAGSNEWGLRLTGWASGRVFEKMEAGRAISGANRIDIHRGGIVEWWVNGPLGIEQGWTVANRPHECGTRGQLTLVLRQSGNLRAQVLSSGRSLAVSGNTGREVLRYTGLAAYDKTGRQLPAHFEATGKDVRVVVDDTGAAYPVRIDPWVQAVKLTASDGAAHDYLGQSVAVSSDGKIAVAGAPGATSGNNTTRGAVYVFEKPASGWANGTQVAKLTVSDSAAPANLGGTIALSSDGTTVVAGAMSSTGGSNHNPGAVYVFKEPASGWANETETAKLTASDSAADSLLGISVAVSSDGTTVVAGDGSAVYVFKEPASGWANVVTQAAALKASDLGFYDTLGDSVAVSSDGTTVAAGLSTVPASRSSNVPAPGAVYVFKEPASGWANGTQTAKLTASGDASGNRLGYSLAVNSDGTTIVAGAWGTTVGSNIGQGAVYVFEEPASGWANGTQTAELTASQGAADDELGLSVAESQDGATIVAGGYQNMTCAVYVYREPASGWANGTQTAEITVPDNAGQTGFGSSVAVSSDGATVVAGAFSESVGGNFVQGAVYVSQTTMGSFRQDAVELGSGWERLSWLGTFYASDAPWIYQQTLGWLYPDGTSTQGVWFYDPQWNGNGGWWWTSASVYPWVYSATEQTWLYYDAGASAPHAFQRWFGSSGGQWAEH